MSTNSPSTQFAGDSNPNSQKNVMAGTSIAFFLAAPIAAITAVVCYILFSYVKISHKVIAGFVGIYAALLIVTGQLLPAIKAYLNSWVNAGITLSSERENADFVSLFFHMALEQAPLSLLIGGVLGAVYSWWRWIRRPSWVEYEFKLSPYEWFRKRRNVANMKADKGTPADGRTLGINKRGERIVQSEAESAAHTFMLGASGAGKTTTLLTGARDAIKRGEGFVFVDMKGSEDVPRILASYAKRYNRPFYHWTSQNPRMPYVGPCPNGPAFYDPIGRGDSTRRKDLLMALREWSEDHYKIIVEDYLQRAFEIAQAVPPKEGVDTIADIISILDPTELKKRSLHVVGDEYYDNIIAEINFLTDQKIDKDVLSAINGMRRQLGVLRDSIQGRWLRKDPKGQNDINLFDVAHNGAVVVFTLDSANYEQNARNIGNLIIQDLKTVSSELRENKSRFPMHVIVDEFSAIGSTNIAGLIARSRDAGIPVTLSTQSLGDLRMVDTNFLDQIVGIVLSFIIHRPNSFEDAEILAGLGGKVEKQIFRSSVEHTTGFLGALGKGAGTGKGTVETKEDFRISPSELQELGAGELVYICKSPFRIERVKVITEDGKLVKETPAPVNNIKLADDMKPTSLIPDSEDKEKYKVDPSINGVVASKYKQEDFDEAGEKPSLAVRKSDPARIRSILDKRNFDEDPQDPGFERGDSLDIPDMAYDFTLAETEPEKDTPSHHEAGLPSLPEVKRPTRESLKDLEAVPKAERKPRQIGKPIRPVRSDSDIALPTIFPTPSANKEPTESEENTKPASATNKTSKIAPPPVPKYRNEPEEW